MTGADLEVSEVISEAISGPVWGVSNEVNSWSILVNSGPFLDPSLGNLIEYLNSPFIWPWVGPKPQNMVNMGPWDGWVGVPV